MTRHRNRGPGPKKKGDRSRARRIMKSALRAGKLKFCFCEPHMIDLAKDISILSYKLRKSSAGLRPMARTRSALVRLMKFAKSDIVVTPPATKVPRRPNKKKIASRHHPIEFVKADGPTVIKPGVIYEKLPIGMATFPNGMPVAAVNSSLESFAYTYYRAECLEEFGPDWFMGERPMDEDTFLCVCSDPLVRAIAAGTSHNKGKWMLKPVRQIDLFLAEHPISEFDNHSLRTVHEVATGGGFLASGLKFNETIQMVNGEPTIVSFSSRAK